MNSRKIVSCFLSRSILPSPSSVQQRLGRYLSTARCASLRVAGSQPASSTAKIAFSGDRVPPVRRYCSVSEDPEQGAMGYHEFKTLVGAQYMLIVDVREPQELNDEGKIAGTVNIPLGQVEAALSKGLVELSKKYHLSTYNAPEGANIVFFCKAGIRAAKAAAIARKHGLTNARYYKGSFLEWKERGEPVIKNR